MIDVATGHKPWDADGQIASGIAGTVPDAVARLFDDLREKGFFGPKQGLRRAVLQPDGEGEIHADPAPICQLVSSGTIAAIAVRAVPSARSCHRREKSLTRTHIALARMSMVRASSVTLKTNEIIACTETVCRIGRPVTATSETWLVIPMTNEK